MSVSEQRSNLGFCVGLFLSTIVCAVPFLCGCYDPDSESIQEDQIPGKYQNISQVGREVLELQKDHTYIQRFTSSLGDTQSNQGSWEFFESSDQKHFHLRLNDYKLLNPDWKSEWSRFHGDYPESVISSVIHRRGKTRVWVNREDGFYYDKAPD